VVGGQHHHDGVRIAGGDQADAECDGGSGVAFGGFREDIAGREHGGVFADGIHLQRIGENQDVLQWDQTIKAADGLLEEGAGTKQIEELFGTGIAAQRPETRAGPTGKNQGIGFVGMGHCGGKRGGTQGRREAGICRGCLESRTGHLGLRRVPL